MAQGEISPALGVSSTLPQANERRAPLNTKISATFNKAIDPATLDTLSFVVFGEKSGKIRGTIGYDDATRTATFQPANNLFTGDRITVVLTSGIASTDGESLANGFMWTFDAEVMQGVREFKTEVTSLDMELVAVASADFDGDGTSDLVVSGVRDGQYVLQIMYYRDGALQAGDLVNMIYEARPVVVGDLNNDGVPDILAVHRNNFSFTTYFVSSAGKIQLGAFYAFGKPKVEPRSASITDLNNDGFLDIVIINRLKNPSFAKTILIYFNDGAGNFGQGNGIETDWFWSNRNAEVVFAKDFNFDGHVDIGATTQGSNGGIAFFMNPGDGWSFSDDPNPRYYMNSDFESVFSSDVSGDEQPDVIVPDLTTDSIIPFFHNGVNHDLPEFVQQESYPTITDPDWLDYGDLDADGDFDFAAIGSDQPRLNIFYNDGLGDFTDNVLTDITPSPKMVTISDLNGDKALDMAIIDYSGDLTLMINDVAGNSVPDSPVPLSPQDDAFVDSKTVNLSWTVPQDADGDALHFIVTITSDNQEKWIYDSRINPELFEPYPPVSQDAKSVHLNVTLPRDGLYSWHVEAFDGIGYSLPSETWQFNIDSTPPADLSLELPGVAFDHHWFDPLTAPDVTARLHYSEQNPDSAILQTVGLGGPYTKTGIPAGDNQFVDFDLAINSVNDGKYDVTGSVVDVVEHKTDTPSWVGVDQNPPVGTTASVLNDTSSSVTISVSWGGGNDGNGSGLSGYYSVQVKVDDGPWNLWLDHVATQDSFYTGQNLHTYYFEAAAFDNLNHFEGFSNTAEATVFVDTTADDITPPGKPKNLRANGSNPSPWQSGNEFVIEWENPEDESGIAKSYWKLGTPPTSNKDYDHEGSAQSPMTIVSDTEDGVMFYLWLEDWKGNVDFHNYSSVLLRRDATSPLIHNYTFADPQPPYTDANSRSWFNSNTTAELTTNIIYTEKHAQKATLNTGGLSANLTNENIPSGENVSTSFDVGWELSADGQYDMQSAVYDSTDNQGAKNIPIGLDGTLPTGSVASTPDVVATEIFTVTWTAGDDGTGSGISGKYDIFVKVDEGNWQKWLVDFTGLKNDYNGAHGHRYAFEAVSKDNVGNEEEFTGIEETAVQVDTTSDDVDPPAAPINLTAGGQSGESPWQTVPDFEINWQNPDDESGVAKSLYKLGSAPTANYDTTGSGPAIGPMTVTMPQEGKQHVFVWLVDHQGNVDFHNYSFVLLRYDATLPIIESVSLQEPVPSYTDATGEFWYNRNSVKSFVTNVQYSEKYAWQAVLNTDGLAGEQTNNNIPGGDHVSTLFKVDISSADDGVYDAVTTVKDSALNEASEQFKIGLDGTPPQGSVANSPEVSATELFHVSWSAGEDVGSGISGEYDVYVRVDNTAWKMWLNNAATRDTVYNGQHGHTYGFEAISKDNVGNVEALTGTAESVTKVDTTSDDTKPPDPPLELTAGGSSPSPWQVDATFEINWQNPADESGIAQSLWKLGAEPTSNYDTTASGPAQGPVNVVMNREGQQWLYLWLVDNRGNVDYKKYSKVLLRRDNARPQITDLKFKNPNASYVDSNSRNWYDQTVTGNVTVQLIYTETQADSIVLVQNGVGAIAVETDPASGSNVVWNFNLRLSDMTDGRYTLAAKVFDVAGKMDSSIILLGLDSKPPENSIASGPEISIIENFTVNWSAGIDSGSGLAGRYRIFSQDNNGPWKIWVNETTELAAEFQGQNEHAYGFEAITWDNLGHQEVITNIPEAVVKVDITAGDTTPPASPIDLKADGENPSPWKSTATFALTWVNPNDLSGIAKSYYKIDAPPVSDTDTTGSGGPTGPVLVKSPGEGEHAVYVWLVDGRGNVEHRNNSRVVLRYDKTPPKIRDASFTNAGYNETWFNQTVEPVANLLIKYGEYHTDSLIIFSREFSIKKIYTDPESDLYVKFNVPIDLSEEIDGSGALYITIIDSAGNRSLKTAELNLDSTPPRGTEASSPAISSSALFAVSWSAGEDAGVGVSGQYDVYVNENEAGWRIWQDKYEGRTADFEGVQGSSYEFEAIAYDFLGNAERLTHIAETKTLVDTTSSDSLAPAPPIDIAVDSLNPSPWQSENIFKVSWKNPVDPSGIIKSWYKLGDPPQNAGDTTATGLGAPPIAVQALKEDGQRCYIWLEDGRHNVNFQNNASILLRWDKTSPIIDSLVLAKSMFADRWFNPKIIKETLLNVFFTESHADSFSLQPTELLGSTAGVVPVVSAGLKSFQLVFPDSADTTVTLKVAIVDSAGNTGMDSTLLSLDSSPPQGTIASSPDTTGPGEFLVSWAGNQTDGNGSGISGSYDVKIKIDDGEWQPWKTRFNGTESSYIGEANHSYSFEAAAYDNVGNREVLLGEAETTTFISIDFSDITPPAAPKDVIANKSNPSPWSNNAKFELNWVNPDDASGIARCYFKLGTPPTANDDTTGSTSGTPPVNIAVEQEGRHKLYLWLKDGRGNVDFHNLDSILVRYDGTPPAIDSAFVANANYLHQWINPDSTDSAFIRIYYNEIYPDTARLFTGAILGELTRSALPGGEKQFIDFKLPVPGLADGCYKFKTMLSDSAGNTAVDSLLLCIDGTPPDSAVASSPEISRTSQVLVSWANEGAGTDGDGSGLSGEYDVRIRINDGLWYDLLKREKKTSTTYVGAQGFTYSFEVAAWDNVGNREAFTGEAESVTKVDTAYIDAVAPDPPVQVLANGENPSPWQNTQEFEITWENPVDPSGIQRVFYKLGEKPENNADTTGSEIVTESTGKLVLTATQENGQMVYLWLQDGKGNSNYENFSSVLLRYDATKPIIDSLMAVAPGFLENWYNQKKREKIFIRGFFTELNPETVTLSHSDIPEMKTEFTAEEAKADSIDAKLFVKDAADGSYWIHASLTDSAGNRSEPDSILIHFDSTPPHVTVLPGDSVVDESADNYQVSAVVTDENHVDFVRLQYWRGGQRSRPLIDMTQVNDSTYTGTIPPDFVTNRGLEYAVLASDGLSTKRDPEITGSPASYPVHVRIEGENSSGMVRDTMVVVGTDVDAYRMISLPLAAIDPSPEAIFGDDFGTYDPKRWRLFHWDTPKSIFNEFPETGDIVPGRAFWLISKINGVTIDTGPGLSVNTSEPFVIVLRKGWNDIGNPFNFNVSWDDIFITSAADTQKIIGPYTYNGQWKIPPQIPVMKPWEGYSLYTESDDISLLIPPIVAKQSLEKSLPLPGYNDVLWALSIEAKNDVAVDAANYIGCAKNATMGWDYGYDYVEPPVIGSYISMYFPHRDWDLNAKKYTTDFRSGENGHVWDFEVTANSSAGEIKLLFHKMVNVPPSLSMNLVDVEANISIDLQRDSTYSFWLSHQDAIRHFKIIAGDVEFMQEHKDDLPAEPTDFELVQNYPNPFNSSTMILYELKETTQVKLGIYNLLAQQVKLLYNGMQEKGFHQFRWDGRDENGWELGTGIYILRLETPNYTSTRKMIFMR